MAFLYGLLRALAAAMRAVAALRHKRAKRSYERSEQAFQSLETECKAHEVRVGRPTDFGAQLRLLKAYEAKERDRARWVRAAHRLEARTGRERWLKDLSGRKLPYSFGLVDMAGVLYLADRLSGWAFEPVELIQRVISAL
jgi:hypothetical protein